MDTQALINTELGRAGVIAGSWREGEDGLEAVIADKWQVINDDEDRGLFAGDEGDLVCVVVGAPEYSNQRAAFYFVPEGQDSGEEVMPYDDVEPI